MSEHKLIIEVQELAAAIQHIRIACDRLEKTIQQSLLREASDGEYSTVNQRP